MELELIRDTFTDKSTTGRLNVDGAFECYVLEDKDRDLWATEGIDKINAKKVHGETCIPYGRYQVVVTKSARFSQLLGHDVYLPLLLNVPGYDGIRIHTGNKPADTEGCLLPCCQRVVDFGSHSTEAFVKLNDKINAAIKAGKQVWITIKKSS